MDITPEQVSKIIELCKPIKRGCWCDYDYRCGNCNNILKLSEYIESLGLKE